MGVGRAPGWLDQATSPEPRLRDDVGDGWQSMAVGKTQVQHDQIDPTEGEPGQCGFSS